MLIEDMGFSSFLYTADGSFFLFEFWPFGVEIPHFTGLASLRICPSIHIYREQKSKIKFYLDINFSFRFDMLFAIKVGPRFFVRLDKETAY